MSAKALSALVLASVLIAGTLTSAGAQPQHSTTVYSSGPWSVLRSNSEPSCTLLVQPAGVPTAYYGVLYRAGRDSVYSSVLKQSWTIPDDVRANVTLVVDRATIGTFNGAGFSRVGLGWNISVAEWRATIANLLMNGVQARVIFHGGNEPEWTINLSGSTAAVAAFVACVNGFGGDISSAPGR